MNTKLLSLICIGNQSHGGECILGRNCMATVKLHEAELSADRTVVSVIFPYIALSSM